MVSIDILVWPIAVLLSLGGALLVALPDIPRLRLILQSERINEGLYQMETTGLSKQSIGYQELLPIIENHYSVKLPNETWALRAGYHTMSRYGFEAIYVFTDPDDQNAQIPLGKELGEGEDYRVVRNLIRNQVSRSEAKVRGIGFVILGTGLAVQVLPQVNV